MRTGGPARQRAALLLAAIGGIVLAGCSRTGDALDAAIARTDGRDPAEPSAAVAPARPRVPPPLPADFPQDIQLPAGYDIDSVLDMDGGTILGLRAPGRAGDLFAETRSAMTQLGWRQTLSRQDSDGNAMLAFEKGPRAAVFSFRRDPESAGVVIGLQLRDRLPGD
ncbi:hypothetical protein [Luteimonas sp. R10]|uniref:hypothetical protein n=1 Tax=Luteimonas sp. R10 TaxID=3108176 RepID=UPI00308CDF1E|nr:hypothetical protein U3649_02095 [Luteimonas sp. R10]